MINRHIAMTGMLGAAVGVPYAISNAPDEWPAWPAVTAEPSAGASGGVPAAGASTPSPLTTPPNFYGAERPLPSTGFYPIEQVFRMDVTKTWVYQQWPRKSTGLADPGLFGVRVPLVTGTGMADLAGSLSYYFNSAGQVDRIRFRGTTADTTRIIGLVQQQYGLTWYSPRVPGEQLLQSRSGDRVVSQLCTFPEPVLRSNKPHGSFGVEVELNRPGSGRFVEEFGPKLQVPPPTQTALAVTEPASVSADTAGAEEQAPISPLPNARRDEFRWPN